MSDERPALHVIGRLDGYGRSKMLRLAAGRQLDAGRRVSVVALSADSSIAAELRSAEATVHVFPARWALDPVAALKLARLAGNWPRGAAVTAWDAVAFAHTLVGLVRRPDMRLIAPNRSEECVPWWFRELIRRQGRRVDEVVVGPWAGGSAKPQALGGAVDLRTHLELDAGASVIATAGPLVRSKDLDEAIWCFELVRVLNPAARLVIFGNGPDRERLERFARLVSEPGCVAFAGYRADLPALLPQVDVFWQLDAPRTTPLALLEAAAAGLPIVATDVPAHRTAAADGERGLLVPHANRAAVARATDRLLRDPALARRLGGAAREFSEQAFTPELALVEYERVESQAP